VDSSQPNPDPPQKNFVGIFFSLFLEFFLKKSLKLLKGFFWGIFLSPGGFLEFLEFFWTFSKFLRKFFLKFSRVFFGTFFGDFLEFFLK